MKNCESRRSTRAGDTQASSKTLFFWYRCQACKSYNHSATYPLKPSYSFVWLIVYVTQRVVFRRKSLEDLTSSHLKRMRNYCKGCRSTGQRTGDGLQRMCLGKIAISAGIDGTTMSTPISIMVLGVRMRTRFLWIITTSLAASGVSTGHFFLQEQARLSGKGGRAKHFKGSTACNALYSNALYCILSFLRGLLPHPRASLAR